MNNDAPAEINSWNAADVGEFHMNLHKSPCNIHLKDGEWLMIGAQISTRATEDENAATSQRRPTDVDVMDRSVPERDEASGVD